MKPISTCVNFENVYSSTDEFEEIETNLTTVFNYDNWNEFYTIFEKYHTWFSIIICCTGLFANAVTVAVLTRPSMISVINNLLTAVAVCDSCLLISCLIFVLHYKFLSDCPASNFTYRWTVFALVHANISVVLRATSLWLSVVVAGHRKTVLYLNQPHVAHEHSSLAPCAVAVTVVAVSLVATPIFLSNSIHQEIAPIDSSCNNETIKFYRVVPSRLSYSYDCFLMKINNFINAFLFKLLPLCFLTYYLISIIVFICKRGEFHRRLLTAENNNNNQKVHRLCCWRISCHSTMHSLSFHPTTVILSSILLMTIVCEMPNAITSVMSGVLSSEFYWWVYRNLGDVFDLLSLFNGLTTFLMYCIMSSSFRTTFVSLFPQRHLRRAINNDSPKKYTQEKLTKSNFNKRRADLKENDNDEKEESILLSNSPSIGENANRLVNREPFSDESNLIRETKGNMLSVIPK